MNCSDDRDCIWLLHEKRAPFVATAIHNGPAIEFKKFFMDERTGEADFDQVSKMHKALLATDPGVLEELRKLT